MKSMNEGSLKDGFQNLNMVGPVHHIIDALVKAGVLPEGARIGRLGFFGLTRFTRTAVSTPVIYLMKYEPEIKNWVEDNTQHNPDDVFNVLLAGAVIGASLGQTATQSDALNSLYRAVAALPSGKAKTKLLSDKATCLDLISRT